MQGLQGPKGDPGNANVETVTFEIRESDYSPYRSSLTGQILWDEALYQVPEVTRQVAENGAVIGYWGEGSTWLILPNLGIDFTIRPGSIETNITRPSSGASFVPLLDGTYLRFVIIYPPSTGNLVGVDVEDYEAVMEALES